jgi:NAD(P)-dependent dehydrogenase (short-subunit alcohol dehydrogenase family)
MSTFNGKVAVVTGAGSGIGAALATRLATEGASLALCDVDESGLAEAAAAARQAGATVYEAAVDVADRAAVQQFAKDVRAEFGVVHQIYNNAGIGHIGPVTDVSYDDIRRVMDVNFWGVVHGTKEFLPHLIESGDGHVVNVSSVFGITSAPWLSGYDASKFAVRGFTEALRAELLAAGKPVRVTCVHPGGVRTPFVQHADAAPGEDLATVEKYFRRITVTTADGAARAILRGVRLNRGRLLIGPDARAADAAQRIFGSQYERVAGLAARWFVPSANK